MKLRLKSDGVRLRLGPNETRALSTGRRIVETIAFGLSENERLTYSIQSADVDEPTVTFADRQLSVVLPNVLVRRWTESEDVAIESQHRTLDGTLTLLIEKDFACMHGEAREIDVFPNPRENAL